MTTRSVFGGLTPTGMSFITVLMNPGIKSDTDNGSSAKRILLLEDDVQLCEALKEWLEMNHFTVRVVHRGVEGVTEILQHDFDAIICDMVMPQMPGDMFYLAVSKARPHLAERFVFITGHRDRPDVAKFLWEFHGPTLNKPLNLEELLDSVKRVINEAIVKQIAALRA
jgi:DNA-binding NtrC family response regulator